MSKSRAAEAAQPLVICETNLSLAWSKVLLYVVTSPGTEIAPLVLSLSGFAANNVIPENDLLREALDALLRRKGFLTIDDVAWTIFPQSLWRMSGSDRSKLYGLYRSTFPRWRCMNKKKNGRGLYFERLIQYGRGPCDGNQLEWILSQYASRSGVRRSMLQATTFDPERDHIATAQLGFPCLQHVSFEPTNSGLVMNAFYATQQIFDKAYGNYLGLAHLGAFMAHEMGLNLARMNVMVGVAKLERINKTDIHFRELVATAQEIAVCNCTSASQTRGIPSARALTTLEPSPSNSREAGRL